MRKHLEESFNLLRIFVNECKVLVDVGFMIENSKDKLSFTCRVNICDELGYGSYVIIGRRVTRWVAWQLEIEAEIPIRKIVWS